MIRRCSTRRRRHNDLVAENERPQILPTTITFGKSNIGMGLLNQYVFISEYKDAFALFDKHKDETIATRDLKCLMRSLGCNPTDLEFQQIVNEVDAKGNGYIHFREFVKVMEKRKQPLEEQASMSDACNVFDCNGNGYIGTAIIRDALLKSLDLIPQEEIEDLFTHLGLAKDRNISHNEFSTFITLKGMMTVKKDETEKVVGEFKSQFISNAECEKHLGP